MQRPPRLLAVTKAERRGRVGRAKVSQLTHGHNGTRDRSSAVCLILGIAIGAGSASGGAHRRCFGFATLACSCSARHGRSGTIADTAPACSNGNADRYRSG